MPWAAHHARLTPWTTLSSAFCLTKQGYALAKVSSPDCGRIWYPCAGSKPPQGNCAPRRAYLRAVDPPPWPSTTLSQLCWSDKLRAPLRFERSEEHTSELQSLTNLVCRLLLEK